MRPPSEHKVPSAVCTVGDTILAGAVSVQEPAAIGGVLEHGAGILPGIPTTSGPGCCYSGAAFSFTEFSLCRGRGVLMSRSYCLTAAS